MFNPLKISEKSLKGLIFKPFSTVQPVIWATQLRRLKKQGLRPDFLSAELCEQSPDLGRPQNENRGEIRPLPAAEWLNSAERFENQALQPLLQ